MAIPEATTAWSDTSRISRTRCRCLFYFPARGIPGILFVRPSPVAHSTVSCVCLPPGVLCVCRGSVDSDAAAGERRQFTRTRLGRGRSGLVSSLGAAPTRHESFRAPAAPLSPSRNCPRTPCPHRGNLLKPVGIPGISPLSHPSRTVTH